MISDRDGDGWLKDRSHCARPGSMVEGRRSYTKDGETRLVVSIAGRMKIYLWRGLSSLVCQVLNRAAWLVAFVHWWTDQRRRALNLVISCLILGA